MSRPGPNRIGSGAPKSAWRPDSKPGIWKASVQMRALSRRSSGSSWSHSGPAMDDPHNRQGVESFPRDAANLGSSAMRSGDLIASHTPRATGHYMGAAAPLPHPPPLRATPRRPKGRRRRGATRGLARLGNRSLRHQHLEGRSKITPTCRKSLPRATSEHNPNLADPGPDLVDFDPTSAKFELTLVVTPSLVEITSNVVRNQSGLG